MMTYTYGGLIDTSVVDWIRFTIGDTDLTNPHISDEEINGSLVLKDNVQEEAAKYCMEYILLKYAQQTDFKIGSTSVSGSDCYKAYKDLYNSFAAQLTKGSLSAPDTSVGTPIFGVGMMDEEGYICTLL